MINQASIKKMPFQLKHLIGIFAALCTFVGFLKVTYGHAAWLALGVIFVFLVTKKQSYALFVLVIMSALQITSSVLVPVESISFRLVGKSIPFILLFMLGTGGKHDSGGRLIWQPFILLFVYIGYMMLISFGGWAPMVSFLKIALFCVFLSALLKGAKIISCSRFDIGWIRALLLAVCVFFIIGGVVSRFFPSIGFSFVITSAEGYGQEWLDSIQQGAGPRLFSGMTNHSQTLGPTMAVLGAFLMADYFTNYQKQSWLCLMLIITVPVLIYWSDSRTGLIAYILSMLLVSFFILRKKSIRGVEKRKFVMLGLCVLIVSLLATIIIPEVREKTWQFIYKTDDIDRVEEQTGGTSDAIFMSRQRKYEQEWGNFKAKPLFGNGFQVDELSRLYMQFDWWWLGGTAVIEKCFLPLMLLEEGGVIGAVAFLIFLFGLYHFCWVRGQYVCFCSTFSAFLFINMGEACFFATGAMGGFFWCMCICALILDINRLSDRSNVVHFSFEKHAEDGGLFHR